MKKESKDAPLGAHDAAASSPNPKQSQSAGDRRCVECGIRLSLYNPGPNCWQHTIGWPWRGPSARPRF